MAETVKRPAGGLSPEAEMVVRNGARSGHSVHKIQKDIRESLGEKATQKQIARRMEECLRNTDTKKRFKKKGADIVAKFLEGAREGADVRDLQAVLEQAVYFDCLRRYASDENFLLDMSPRDLLKITSEYRKQKLKSASEKAAAAGSKFPFSPVHALEIIALVEESLADAPELRAAVAKRKDTVLKKIEPLFNRREFETAKEDYETMQRIRERYERSKLEGAPHAGSNGTASA